MVLTLGWACYTVPMFAATGESRFISLAVRFARPARIVLTLAVCLWLAWDVHRKLTVRPRPGPVDRIELPRLPGSEGRPDVTDEMRDALAFFSKNSPMFAFQTIWPSDALAGPWEPADRAELRFIIQYLESRKVGQALDRVGALSPGALRIPTEDLFEYRVPIYSPARWFALHMLPRARLRWEGQNDPGRGWADVVAVFRVIRMLYEQPATVSHLTAMGMEMLAQRELLNLLMDCPPPEPLCRQMAAEFEAQDLPQRGLFAFVARADARFRERLIDKCYTNDGRGGGWPDLCTAHQAWNGGPERSPWWNLGSCFFNDRRTVLAKNERWTGALVDADLPDVSAALAHLDRLTAAHRAWTVVDFPAEFTLSPGGAGRPREQRRYIMMASVYTGREAIRAGLALAAFRTGRGAYPDRLEQLVPEFLPELPKDLFDGQPLRYRRDGAGYRLYSLCQNRRDDGGIDFDPATRERLDYTHASPRWPLSSPATLVPGFAWDPQGKRYEPVGTPSTNPAPPTRPAGVRQ